MVLCVNAGGLADKLHRLLALLYLVEPDVVIVQEVWTRFDPSSVGSTPFHAEVTEPYDGGGLLTLIHRRHTGAERPRVKRGRHHLCVAVRSTPKSTLSVANVHLPPRHTPDQRHIVVQAVAAFAKASPGIQVLGGDLNESLGSKSKSNTWLGRALRDPTQWGAFRCPYQPGVPTNYVPNKSGGCSARELDWVFVGATTPTTGAARCTLPGLSTHRSLVCVLDLAPGYMVPADPKGSKLRFANINDADLDDAASVSALAFWWGERQALSVDHSFQLYWEMCASVLPSARQAFGLSDASADKLLASRSAEPQEGDADLQRWWRRKQDAACERALEIASGQLDGVSITSTTRKQLRLSGPKFQQVQEVSADGQHFPTEPVEFKEEALRQAQELHCSRSMPTDTAFLSSLSQACPEEPADDPDLRTAIASLQTQAAGASGAARPLDTAATPRDLESQLSAGGSKVVALDELPQQLLKAFPGFGLATLCRLLARVMKGERSRILCAVLHLLLVKKAPRWLLRNSRPILLEAALLRIASSIMFGKVLSAAELSGLVPPTAFAYRKSLSQHALAILCRWLIAAWVRQGRVWVLDWDESNAFCNVERDGLARLLEDHPEVDCGQWIRRFYGSLEVYVVTPFGLTGPYELLHGGVQGDSMGVGSFTLVGIFRSRANKSMVVFSLRPETGGRGGPSPADYCFYHPAFPDLPVFEFSFSDDRRLISSSSAGAAHLLDVGRTTCTAAAGSLNALKLEAFAIDLEGDRLLYGEGTVCSVVGDLPTRPKGLGVVGIPIVMGDAIPTKLTDLTSTLRRLRQALRRTRPSYVLACRVILSFAISGADFVADVVPVDEEATILAQVECDGALREAMLLPQGFPKAVLRAPLSQGGIGAPHLAWRFRIRRVAVLLKTLNSRSSLTREALRHLWNDPGCREVASHDGQLAQEELRSWGLAVGSLQGPLVGEAPVSVNLLREPTGTEFTFVSDGSSVPGRMGLGAVMVDADGVFAELKCGFKIDKRNAWAAEWLSKMLPVHVALDVLRLTVSKVLCVADCSSAIISNRPANPSAMPVVDKVRLAFARWAAASPARIREAYMQAQHNSLHSSPAARWQARAHDLSTEARTEAWARSLPMKDILGDVWVLLRGDCVCLSPSDTLDSVYESHLPPGRHLTDLFRAHPGAGSLWVCMVESGAFSNQELNTFMWVRAAPWMHSAASSNVLCPFCRLPVPGWGAHLPGGCVKLAQALLYAFRAMASHLVSLGFHVHWRSVIHFVASSGTVRPVDVSLVSDEDFACSQRSHRAVAVSWSGLWIGHDDADQDLRRDDLLHHFARALTLAARGDTWPLFEEVCDRCPSTSDFAAPWRVAARVQSLVQAAGDAEWDTPADLWGSSVGLRYREMCNPSSASHRALWGQQSPNPVEGVVDWTFSRPALRMHHPDTYVQFCGAGLVLRGPHQMLSRRILDALTLVNSTV